MYLHIHKLSTREMDKIENDLWIPICCHQILKNKTFVEKWTDKIKIPLLWQNAESAVSLP